MTDLSLIELLKAVVYGIIEGITEWLPISSTGHLILADEFFPLQASAAFREMFTVVIQFGAILAVVVLYWNTLFPFSFKGGLSVKKGSFSMWFKILVACVPAAIYAFTLDDIVSPIFYNYITVAIMLILVGLLFIVVERFNKNKTPKVTTIGGITYPVAFVIGLAQLVAAVFPGTSRSGATIICGLLLGLSRGVAAEFTFFLAIPAMVGASAIKLLKFGSGFTGAEALLLLAGTLTAFIVSVLAIKFLVGFIKKHSFTAFGWYRIALGIAVLLYFALQR